MATGADQGTPLNKVLVEEFNLLHDSQLQPIDGVNPDRARKLDSNASLAELYAEVHRLHANGQPRSALCLSGGGIRSASFALGVLHGLAERGLLDSFTYLSTVSGGGYIGGWLSAWRTHRSNATVTDELKERTLRGVPPNADYKESPEVAGLRAFSNYLTPKLGVMSADTWTLATLYVRNLLLNWLIYLPAFIAVLLLPFVARACLDWSRAAPELHHQYLVGIALLLLLAASTVSVKGRIGNDKAWRVGEPVYLGSVLLPTYVAAMFISAYAVGPNHAGNFEWKDAALAGGALYLLSWMAILPNLPWIANGGNAESRLQLIFSFIGRSSYWGGRAILLLLAWVLAGGIAAMLIGWGCRLAAGLVKEGPDAETGYRLIVIFGVGWVAASLFIAEGVYLGLTSYWKRGDSEREWLARSSGWFLAMAVGWSALAATALYGADLAAAINGAAKTQYASWIAGAAGGGIGAIIARIGRSTTTAAKTVSSAAGKIPTNSLLALGSILFLLSLAIVVASWLPSLMGWFLALPGVARLPGLVLNGAAWLGLQPGPTVAGALVSFLASVAVVLVVARFINVNRFSAHALYRNRLARAFLGSARGHAGIDSSTRDPFTGFDDADNLQMAKLRVDGHLYHVVNMALNVVSGDNKAWQERKAESFVVTPRHAGNEFVGFAQTAQFGSSDGGITLGTSIAISGAAASPNQGYHSSPLIGFVMTLFNARLGWWLGNPRFPARARLEGPKRGIVQVVAELFGLTTDKSPFVYLSDGGHFENLGLYEMVRRRCHLIVVSDGGCDPECAFEDLGNAVRKIWIDLGVSIDFRKIDIQKRGFPSKNLYCALGVIRYPERIKRNPADVGYVLYIKPGFHNDGREPADVTAYALANMKFPHETTADQFFSESQLESYRSLGAYIIKTILGEKKSNDMSAPTEALRPYWSHLQTYLKQINREDHPPDPQRFAIRDKSPGRIRMMSSRT